MIDVAKFADLALLLIDGSYGFEMVRFWFLRENRLFRISIRLFLRFLIEYLAATLV